MMQSLKFHPPGLAPFTNQDGAYHINTKGIPAYTKRYLRSFGFYELLASVVDIDGWLHIHPDGSPLYEARYAWCGNFQNQVCVVKDKFNNYFHIGSQGQRLYSEDYAYAGDFRDGIAVVQNKQGLYTHIRKSGELLHQKWFQDLDVFHKGFARAKESRGWFHVNLQGEENYSERYSMVEPFYNGVARVETFEGEMVRIEEDGHLVESLRHPLYSEFQSLSADLVGYWKTQTIKSAAELNLFELLPNDLETLSRKTDINHSILQRFLKALEELKLIQKIQNNYLLTKRGEYLRNSHPLSLRSAATHWGNAHYLAWMKLTEALKVGEASYRKCFSNELFEWLDQDQARLTEYHHAMKSYAQHDYPALIKQIDFSSTQKIIDAAGGQGVFIQEVLNSFPHIQGILLERPSLIESLNTPTHLSNRLKILGFDLFQSWPATADTIVLSRVLHDWNDESCLKILHQAYQALSTPGRLLIVEMLIEEESSNGGMLDMNMLVITGGKERTLDEYRSLIGKALFNFNRVKTIGNYSVLEFSK